MTNGLEDFMMKYRDKLIQMVQDYLSKKISHHEIKEFVWSIMGNWESIPDEIKTKDYIKGEKAFWAIVWKINTAADEEHWKDNCPQKVLPELLEAISKLNIF